MAYVYDKLVDKIQNSIPYNHFVANIGTADWSIIMATGATNVLLEKNRTYFINNSKIKDIISIREWTNRLLLLCAKIYNHESLVMNRNLELLFVVCNRNFLESCYEQIAQTNVSFNVSLCCDYEPTYNGVDHLVLKIDKKYYYVKINGAEIVSFNEVNLDEKLIENYKRFLTSRVDMFTWNSLVF